MKALPITLFACAMCCAVASAKDKPTPNYQAAVFEDVHASPVRMNCYGLNDSQMSKCHDADVLIYMVKIGAEVYALTPYNTRPHKESLWHEPAGSAVAAWNDGNRLHVKIDGKESQYDIIDESVDDARR